MDQTKFVTQLLNNMEKARPPLKGADELLTDAFMQKHTKFSSFKEMLQLAIKESGMLEEYLKNLKESVITADVEQNR